MRVECRILYDLDELPEAIQKRVIEKHRDINVDGSHWHEDFLYFEHEKLTALGYENAGIFFSGFGSQGDGACFDADIDVETVLKRLEGYDRLLKISDYIVVTIEKTGFHNMYCHEKTRTINVYLDSCRSEDYVHIGYLLEELEEELEEERLSLCREI